MDDAPLRLAEDLVSRFENAFDEAMLDDAPPAEPPSTPWDAAPSAAPLATPWDTAPPAAPPAAPRRVADPSAVPGDAGFTFDFKVLERAAAEAAPVTARRDEDGQPPPAADPAFPVPEFELPGGRGSAAASSDDAVEAGAQRKSFNTIMDENFTPPVRDLSERPTTPLARGGRPHLVALDGAAAFAPPVPTASPPVQAFQPPPPPESQTAQETVEFDVLREFDDEIPAADEIAAADIRRPTVEHRPLSSEEARTLGIGPATIEFRPLVDGDIDDPDDFAGAC